MDALLCEIYAYSLVELLPVIAKQLCPACEVDDQSQWRHMCVMLPPLERIHHCWETLLETIDHYDVFAEFLSYLPTNDIDSRIFNMISEKTNG